MIPVLTIGDLEESSGVPRTTIHFYLSIGLLPRPQKTARSRSLYTKDHLESSVRSWSSKQAGFALAEIETAATADGRRKPSEGGVDLAAQEHQRVHESILALAAQELVAKAYKDDTCDVHRPQARHHHGGLLQPFSSKRALLAECVSALSWIGASSYVDSKEASTADPAERLLWLVLGTHTCSVSVRPRSP